MKKLVFSFFVLAIAFGAANSTAFAQRETSTGVDVETDLILLRRDMRTDKKKLIALNLPLTETEATKFWPGALFFQIDRRLYAVMDLQTSSLLPLMVQ